MHHLSIDEVEEVVAHVHAHEAGDSTWGRGGLEVPVVAGVQGEEDSLGEADYGSSTPGAAAAVGVHSWRMDPAGQVARALGGDDEAERELGKGEEE